MASLCEIGIIDCIQYKKHVCKERKETTHGKIGEKKNIHNYIRKIRTMYVNNGHKIHVQE